MLACCPKLGHTRREIEVEDGWSLQQVLDDYNGKLETDDVVEVCRYFLGQDRTLDIHEMRNRGNAILTLMDRFFTLWEINGEQGIKMVMFH